MRVLIVSADRTMESGYPSSIGDAWLTDSLVRAVRRQGHEVCALDFGARRAEDGSSEPRYRASGVRGLARAIADSDMVLIGGGTMLQDDVGAGLGGLPRLTCVASNLARVAGRRCVFFGVGVDPVTRVAARSLLRVAVRGRLVAARDEWSARRAAGLGAGGALVAGDCVWLDAGDGETPDAAHRHGAVVALAHGDGGLISARAVQILRERYGKVTFLQMDQRPEAGDAAGLDGEVLKAFDEVTIQMSPRRTLELLRAAEAVFTSRLHALYGAAVCGASAVAVGNRPKVRQFSMEFGVPMAEDLTDLHTTLAARRASDSAVADARKRSICALGTILSTALSE